MTRVYVTDYPIRPSELADFFQNPYHKGGVSVDFPNQKQARKFANQMRSQGNTVIMLMI